MENEENYQPKIICFLCNWCSYAAADLAGSMRLKYPSNIKIVRLACSGRVDVTHLLKCFENGADGVFVAGCEEGSCHYLEGNLWAKKRINYTRHLLQEVGLEKERLEMYNISASQAKIFVQIARDFTERIIKITKNITENSTRK